jgi:hypothetical protein
MYLSPSTNYATACPQKQNVYELHSSISALHCLLITFNAWAYYKFAGIHGYECSISVMLGCDTGWSLMKIPWRHKQHLPPKRWYLHNLRSTDSNDVDIFYEGAWKDNDRQVKDSDGPGPLQGTVSTFPRTNINKKKKGRIAGNLAAKRSECTPARMSWDWPDTGLKV